MSAGGRLVWMPEGWVAVDPDVVDTVNAIGDPVNPPLPPTAADIDALVTEEVLLEALQGRLHAAIAKRSPAESVRMSIKAALRELLIVKEPEVKPRLDNDYCDVPGMRGRGNW